MQEVQRYPSALPLGVTKTLPSQYRHRALHLHTHRLLAVWGKSCWFGNLLYKRDGFSEGLQNYNAVTFLSVCSKWCLGDLMLQGNKAEPRSWSGHKPVPASSNCPLRTARLGQPVGLRRSGRTHRSNTQW